MLGLADMDALADADGLTLGLTDADGDGDGLIDGLGLGQQWLGTSVPIQSGASLTPGSVVQSHTGP